MHAFYECISLPILKSEKTFKHLCSKCGIHACAVTITGSKRTTYLGSCQRRTVEQVCHCIFTSVGSQVARIPNLNYLMKSTEH